MPPRRVQRLLTKKTRVLAEDVPAIARALDTTISSLYGEDESEAATS